MKHHRVSLLSSLVASSLVLVACGGGSERPASADAPAEAAVEDARAEFASAPAPAFASRSEQDFASAAGAAGTASAVSTSTTVQAIAYPSEVASSDDGRAFALAANLAAAGPSNAFRIFVSPDGNDAWSGQLATATAGQTNGPVKTIAAAQSLARQQLAKMANGSSSRLPVYVLIGAGEYRLSAPLSFSSADSGTEAAPVVYAAVTAGTVLISGGVALSQQPSSAGVSLFANPAEGANQWDAGGQLFVNGKRAILARQPNAGAYWFVKQPAPLPSEPSSAQGQEAFTMFSDAQAWINTLTAPERSRAIINVMHSWTAAQARFSEAAVPSDTLGVKPRALWPYLKFGTSQRYFIENVPAALDAPGEWLWDSTGVRYINQPGDAVGTTKAVMPILERLVVVSGDYANNRLVSNLQFTGLSFAHTRRQTSAQGFNDSQAATDVSAAIEVDGASNLVIDNCTISQTGGYGVWFRRAVRNSKIANSTLTDLGAGGIKMGQTLQSTKDAVQTGMNTATSNRVSEVGKVYPGAVAIWVGQGFDNVVSQNTISNTTYSGISVGWTWGYATATSGRNRITNNLLFNIGQGVLDDMAGIYTLGISQDTVVSGNVIREVSGYPGYGVGAWGIYNDAGTSGVMIQNNTVVSTSTGGYHLNYGRQNIVRGNVFAYGKGSEFTVTHTDPAATKLRVQNNVLFPSVARPFVNYAMAPDALFSTNVVSSSTASTTLDIANCGSGCVTQPMRVNLTPAVRSISLAGVTPISAATLATRVANAGVPEALNSTAEEITVPPPPALAPPMAFEMNFANATLGTQPAGFQYFPKGDLNAMRVVSDSSAPGGRCLQFNDSASMPANYFPFVFAALNHAAGTTTLEFALKIDGKSKFFHEWRDNASPYLVGPSLRVSSQGVLVRGNIVAPAAAGEWLRFKIITPVGGTGSTWTLEVRRPNGAVTTIKDLEFGSADWKSLNWLGFVSDARTNSTMCLADVKATSSVQ
jgi:hypothetical protein